MNGQVRRQIFLLFCLFWIVITAAGAAHLSDSVRLLIKFDQTGHAVHNFYRQAGDHNRLAGHSDTTHLADSMHVRWIDSTGRVLETTDEPDPRLAHAPPADDSARPTHIALTEGAYLISGPLAAVMLEIDLAEQPLLALAAEHWTLMIGNGG